jgi:succinate-semialdehyde dehydrogenase / glutarate-semialdehyde dehydrogenase
VGARRLFLSRDIGLVWRVAEGLEYGIVGINGGIISTEIAPFGGMKESAIGREGSKYGRQQFARSQMPLHGGVDRQFFECRC